MRDIVQELHDKVKEDLTPLEVKSMYDDMLDECYDLSTVGGPFSYMQPSRVLEECDPVAYRCGFTDWTDGERFYEVDGEYYHGTDLERVKDELIDELESELSDLQEDIDVLCSDDDQEVTSEFEATHQNLLNQITILLEYQTTLRKYSF